MTSMRATIAFTLAAGLALAGAAQAGRRAIVVSSSDVGKYWQMTGNATPAMFRAPSAANGDVCIALGFRIQEDGSTGEFSVLQTWGSANPGKAPSGEQVDAMVQAAAASAAQRHFAPVVSGKPTAIYTSATFVFLVQGGKDMAPAVAGHCEIANLKAFINHARQDDPANGEVERENLRASGHSLVPVK